MANFKEDIAKVKAFVFDVDGVMTDGGIMPIGDGSDFIRKYNAKDGYAIAYAVRRGYKVCIISGGHGNLLRSRMERLGVTRMYLGCMDKIRAMHEFFADYDVDPSTTIYMGDDIPDLECMELVGIIVRNCSCCELFCATATSERHAIASEKRNLFIRKSVYRLVILVITSKIQLFERYRKK